MERNGLPFDPHRRIAAVFLLREDGAVLMQHRDDKPGLPRAGMWVVPGGHVDTGETILEAARREFLEETDYDCDDLRFLRTVLDRETDDKPFHELHMFWDRYDGTSAYRCLEGQDLRFMERQEAVALGVPENLITAWDAIVDANHALSGDRQ